MWNSHNSGLRAHAKLIKDIWASSKRVYFNTLFFVLEYWIALFNL